MAFRAHIMAEAMSPETAAKALQQPVVQKVPHLSLKAPGQWHEAQMHKALDPVFLAIPAASMRARARLEQVEAKQRAPNVAMAVWVTTSSESLSG